MTPEPDPPSASPPSIPTAARPTPWPWWVTAIVVLGALLTAVGGLLAIYPAGEHLTAAGRNYADYLVTRNVAMAVMLLLMRALRVRAALTALMILTALIQVMDAVTASFTGRLELVPVDLVFAVAFMIGAAHLSTRPLWRATSWPEIRSPRGGADR